MKVPDGNYNGTVSLSYSPFTWYSNTAKKMLILIRKKIKSTTVKVIKCTIYTVKHYSIYHLILTSMNDVIYGENSL